MLLRSVSWAAVVVAIVCGSIAPSARAQELPPSRAEEVELFDYTVVEGDTCAGISQRFFGNRRRYDLIHAYNPNMGPPPHDLQPGTVLRLPRRATPASQLADATVTGVERRVEARPRPADDAWVAAQRGLGLYRGGRVATQQRSAAELTFRDTSVVQLREHTLVIIFGPSSTTTRTAGMEATLETGALRTRLGELRGEASGGNTLRVVTSSGTATLQGGSAVVGVDEQGTSRLSNHSSGASMQSSSGGRPVTLPQNTGSMVRRGQRPTPPRPLPPAPTWQSGTRRFLGVAGVGGDLEGTWAQVPSASRYRIEIARQADGRDVVFATEVDASITGFQAHRLPGGTYYVTVATLDGDLFESRPSTAERFEIVEGRVVRPGEDPSAPAPAFDPGDPTAEPAARIDALEGTLYFVPEGFTCGSPSPISLRYDDLRSCNDASGASVSYPPFEIVRVETNIDGVPSDPSDPDQTVFGPALTLARGQTRTIVLEPSLVGGLPADLTLVAEPGVTIEEVTREGDRFTVRLAASEQADSMVALHWVRESAPTQVMGRMRALVGERGESPAPHVEAPATIEAPRQPRLTEAYARSPVVSALALTDLDRRGSTVGLSIAEIAPAPRAEGLTERTRLAITADLSLLDDQIQIGTLVFADVAGRARSTWDAGSLDVYAHARWVPLRRDPSAEDSLALAVDLGAWFPTHPEGLDEDDRSGLPLVRLAPSIEVAYAIARVASFRTRQGALIDLDDTGARLWASAYGVDVELMRAITMGIELDLVLGPEIEANLFAIGLSPQLAVSFDPLTLGLGMRFGLNRDGQALFGAASVAISASYAFR